MIRNCILDIGGVLLDYRWKQALMDHSLSEAEAVRIGQEMFMDPYWKMLDLGVPTDNVIKLYREQFPKDIDVITWFLEHGELLHVGRPKVWDAVHRLKRTGCRIYLLSNYSHDLFKKQTCDLPVMTELDGKVISYEIGIIKPDERIYRFLLQKYALLPEECIFLDDREENTAAARALGIRSVTVRSAEHAAELIEELIREDYD